MDIINENNLAVLKSRKISLVDESSQTKFIPNKHYRCIEADGGYIVYGVWFNKGTFDNMFEFLHDRMMTEWSENGLLPMMKPLSKKESYDYFKHQLDSVKVTAKIFMDNATETIITVSKGIPRMINTIALKSMHIAADKKLTTVDQECVMAVLDELGVK